MGHDLDTTGVEVGQEYPSGTCQSVSGPEGYFRTAISMNAASRTSKLDDLSFPSPSFVLAASMCRFAADKRKTEGTEGVNEPFYSAFRSSLTTSLPSSRSLSEW